MRLEAIPTARYTMQVQQERERNPQIVDRPRRRVISAEDLPMSGDEDYLTRSEMGTGKGDSKQDRLFSYRRRLGVVVRPTLRNANIFNATTRIQTGFSIYAKHQAGRSSIGHSESTRDAPPRRLNPGTRRRFRRYPENYREGPERPWRCRFSALYGKTRPSESCGISFTTRRFRH